MGRKSPGATSLHGAPDPVRHLSGHEHISGTWGQFHDACRGLGLALFLAFPKPRTCHGKVNPDESGLVAPKAARGIGHPPGSLPAIRQGVIHGNCSDGCRRGAEGRGWRRMWEMVSRSSEC